MSERTNQLAQRLEQAKRSALGIPSVSQVLNSDSEEEEVQSNTPPPTLMANLRGNIQPQGGNIEDGDQGRSIRDFAAPKRVGDLSCIRRPPITTTNFEVKPITMTMLNNVSLGVYQVRIQIYTSQASWRCVTCSSTLGLVMMPCA